MILPVIATTLALLLFAQPAATPVTPPPAVDTVADSTLRALLAQLNSSRTARETTVSTQPPETSDSRVVTVRVRLTVAGDCRIASDQDMELVCGTQTCSVPRGQHVDLARGGAVKVADKVWLRLRDTLSCTASQEGTIDVGRRRYRGSLSIFRGDDGAPVVVNVVSVEDYLASVVPSEIWSRDTQTVEAVKAQTVAARSFAFYRLKTHRYSGYDLWDSYLRDQEYRGAASETELARQAAAATRNEILTCEGTPAATLYHANCGGTTSDGPFPYLAGVNDTPDHAPDQTPFCAGTRNSSWRVTVTRDGFERAVGRLVGVRTRLSIQSFRVNRDQTSGRTKYLFVVTNQGEFRVRDSDLRKGLRLKSQNFDVKLRGLTFVIAGRGYGHGHGMCQDGAIAMARAGYEYPAILQHYYSGLVLTRQP
jgi:stage II sporulation protein D